MRLIFLAGFLVLIGHVRCQTDAPLTQPAETAENAIKAPSTSESFPGQDHLNPKSNTGQTPQIPMHDVPSGAKTEPETKTHPTPDNSQAIPASEDNNVVPKEALAPPPSLPLVITEINPTQTAINLVTETPPANPATPDPLPPTVIEPKPEVIQTPPVVPSEPSKEPNPTVQTQGIPVETEQAKNTQKESPQSPAIVENLPAPEPVAEPPLETPELIPPAPGTEQPPVVETPQLVQEASSPGEVPLDMGGNEQRVQDYNNNDEVQREEFSSSQQDSNVESESGVSGYLGTIENKSDGMVVAPVQAEMEGPVQTEVEGPIQAEVEGSVRQEESDFAPSEPLVQETNPPMEEPEPSNGAVPDEIIAETKSMDQEEFDQGNQQAVEAIPISPEPVSNGHYVEYSASEDTQNPGNADSPANEAAFENSPQETAGPVQYEVVPVADTPSSYTTSEVQIETFDPAPTEAQREIEASARQEEVMKVPEQIPTNPQAEDAIKVPEQIPMNVEAQESKMGEINTEIPVANEQPLMEATTPVSSLESPGEKIIIIEQVQPVTEKLEPTTEAIIPVLAHVPLEQSAPVLLAPPAPARPLPSARITNVPAKIPTIAPVVPQARRNEGALMQLPVINYTKPRMKIRPYQRGMMVKKNSAPQRPLQEKSTMPKSAQPVQGRTMQRKLITQNQNPSDRRQGFIRNYAMVSNTSARKFQNQISRHKLPMHAPIVQTSGSVPSSNIPAFSTQMQQRHRILGQPERNDRVHIFPAATNPLGARMLPEQPMVNRQWLSQRGNGSPKTLGQPRTSSGWWSQRGQPRVLPTRPQEQRANSPPADKPKSILLDFPHTKPGGAFSPSSQDTPNPANNPDWTLRGENRENMHLFRSGQILQGRNSGRPLEVLQRPKTSALQIPSNAHAAEARVSNRPARVKQNLAKLMPSPSAKPLRRLVGKLMNALRNKTAESNAGRAIPTGSPPKEIPTDRKQSPPPRRPVERPGKSLERQPPRILLTTKIPTVIDPPAPTHSSPKSVPATPTQTKSGLEILGKLSKDIEGKKAEEGVQEKPWPWPWVDGPVPDPHCPKGSFFHSELKKCYPLIPRYVLELLKKATRGKYRNHRHTHAQKLQKSVGNKV